jgi:hypothetical protein
MAILPDSDRTENTLPPTDDAISGAGLGDRTDRTHGLDPDEVEEYETWLEWLDEIHDQDRHEDEVIRAMGCVEARRGPAR